MRPIPCLVAILILAPSPSPAQDGGPEAVLKGKGLRKTGSTYVVAGEAEVQKKLTAARALYAQASNGLARQRARDQERREAKGMIRELTQQRIMLNARFGQPMTLAENNQLVGMVNNVTDRLNLLQRQDQGEDDGLDVQVGKGREAYVQAVIDLRVVVDATNAAYDSIAKDGGVTGAIAALAAGKAKGTLGPSRAYLANVKLLEKAEGAVLTDTIPLRKEGGIYWVDVMFNGKVTRPMAFDTGASDVVLPSELAASIGLRPGKDTPTVRCRVADGSIVEAKQMTVPSMRLGKFTVKDVSCTIMPEGKSNVPPLLGQTFQKNFSLKFSPEAATLVLTRIETPEDTTKPGPVPKAKAKFKPAAKRPAGAGVDDGTP